MYKAILFIIGLMATLPGQASVFDNCKSSSSFNGLKFNHPDFTTIDRGFFKNKIVRFGYSMMTTKDNTNLDQVTWAAYAYGTKPVVYTNHIHGGSFSSKSFTATTKKYTFRIRSINGAKIICNPKAVRLTVIKNGKQIEKIKLKPESTASYTVITNYEEYHYGNDQMVYNNVRSFLKAVKHRSKMGIFKHLNLPNPLGVVYRNNKLKSLNPGSLSFYHNKPFAVYGYPNQAHEVTISSKQQYLKYFSKIFTPAFRRWASIQASGLLPYNKVGPFLKYVQFNSDGEIMSMAIVPKKTLNMTLQKLANKTGYFMR